MTEPVETLDRTSVATQAAEAIRQMVISGELRAGQTLPAERQLAQMLDISRPTLRQALGALTAMNILESRHGGGTYVTDLSPQLLTKPIEFLLQIDDAAVESLFEVRRVLEVSACEMAATRITDEQLAELQAALDRAGQVVGQPEEFIEQDRVLHESIIHAVGNPIYIALCDSISRLSMESRRRTGAALAVRRRAHADHVAIVSALVERDPDKAAEAMRQHLLSIETAARRAGRPGSPRP